MSEYTAKRDRTRAPTHPGALLRDEVLPALDISVMGAAERLHVTRQTLHRLLAERTAVTPAMALRLGKFCGNGPDIWLRMQNAYDLWHEGEACGKLLPAFRPQRWRDSGAIAGGKPVGSRRACRDPAAAGEMGKQAGVSVFRRFP